MYGKTTDQKKTYVKLLGMDKTEKEVAFVISEKGKKKLNEYLEDQRFDFIEGYISSIERSSYEFEGKIIPLVEFKIEDGKEEVIFSVSFNQISRSILNSLASQKELGKIKFKVYAYEKNDKLTKGVTVTNDGVKCNWLLSIDEQKALQEPITDKKGEVVKIDRDALDEKLMELVSKVKFSGYKDIFDSMTESKMSDEIEDLPF